MSVEICCKFSDFLSTTSKDILGDYLIGFKSGETKNSYLNEINNFADYTKKDILEVSANDCYKYIKHLENIRNNNNARTSTIVKKKRQLSSLFTYITKHRVKYGINESFSNYFFNIKMDEVNTKIRYDRVPDVSQLNSLYLFLKEHDILCCIAFILSFKGFLTMEEFRTLTIDSFYKDHNDKLVVKVVNPSTPLDIHYNSIPDDAAELLLNYFDNLYIKFPTVNSPCLFSKDGIKPLSPRTMRYRLNKAIEALNLPHFTFNDLRNAGTVYAVAYHADINLVANSLGLKTNRHIKRLDSLIIKVNDAADYIGIQFKTET